MKKANEEHAGGSGGCRRRTDSSRRPAHARSPRRAAAKALDQQKTLDFQERLKETLRA